MPPTQKALLLKRRFGDFALDTITVPAPGAGEIRIRISASALNPVDWKIQRHGIFVDTFPAILGSDIAGEVDARGEGVAEFGLGDRVFTQGLRANVYAGFQQYALARATTVSKIPRGVSDDGAASLPVALSAAYLALYNGAPHGLGFAPPVSPAARGKYAGTPIVVLGGASSVGQSAIQLAKISGFSPILTTASPRHTAHLEARGATRVLDRALPPAALAAAVGRATAAPVLTVLDAISTEETQQAGLAVLAPGGRMAVVQQPTGNGRAGRTVVQVIGGLALPHNIGILSEFYHDVVYEFLEKGWLKPNNVEVLPGGLAGIVDGLRRLEADLVSGVKLVARPQET